MYTNREIVRAAMGLLERIEEDQYVNVYGQELTNTKEYRRIKESIEKGGIN